ncbi:MAG TPA: peptidylprolyl isomerase [Acetobacteraceae bacterium]|nr:peptidylprolyl isomerase [Acetobacteraceae bacterium]
MRSTPVRLLLLAASLAPLAWMAPSPAQAEEPAADTAAAAPAPALAATGGEQDRIVAVVNGEIITASDVTSRSRLFALSTGMPVSEDVLKRLAPQIIRQLTDERLRMQEVQRRKIVVPDQDVARAIADIEQRNGMQPGMLMQKLRGQGVAMTTLINQIRSQLGWTHVLRQQLGGKAQITPAEIAEQQAILKAETGQPQYHVGEIFIPVEDPAHAQDTRHFADTVIQQLRAGAPFPVVAAQFSQSQTALEGGDLGWVRPDQLDPEVAQLVSQMPEGAISNPVHVAGGYSIIIMHGTRKAGQETETKVSLRQAFVPFTEKLDPQNPTAQQKQALHTAQAISHDVHDCAAIEAANKQAGSGRPSDPGPLVLEQLNPQMRAILAGLKIGEATRPLVTPEGIEVLMVCSRETAASAGASREEIANQLLQERVELASRQLLRDLRRRALIDQRA